MTPVERYRLYGISLYNNPQIYSPMAKKKEHIPDLMDIETLQELLSILPKPLQKRYKAFSAKLKALPEETRELFLDLTLEMDMLQSDTKQFLEEQEEMNAKSVANSSLDDDSDDYDDCDYPCFLPSLKVQRFTLRISLKDAPVPIWRRVVVPSNITLRHLSELLIELMGWSGGHLNQFEKGRHYFQPAPQIESDDFNDCEEQERYTIAQLLEKVGQSCTWEYDFGDSWRHEIKLSGVAEYQPGEEHLIEFKAGEGYCPPEDCCGVWGYEELLALHEKRKAGKRLTKDEKERLEWYNIDEDYDPHFLDLEECIFIAEDFN